MMENKPQTKNNSEYHVKQPTVQPFRSMKSDMVDVAQSNEKSVAQLVIAAQEKKRRKQWSQNKQEKAGATNQKKVMTILLAFLLAVTIAVLGVTLKEYLYERNTEVVLHIPSMLTPNDQLELAIGGMDRSDFIGLINNTLVTGSIYEGQITHYYFTNAVPGATKTWFKSDTPDIVSLTHLLELTSNTPPTYIKQSLQGGYMFGAYGSDKAQTQPFLLLGVSDYNSAFAGMLDWEKDIESDFTILFKLRNSKTVAHFEDVYVSNLDARMLKTLKGETALLYSFIEPTVLLITTNEDSLSAVSEAYKRSASSVGI